MQFQSFDPFGPSSAVSSQRSQSNFQDPFAPSFSSAKQHVSSSQGVSFDPFSPFPLQQNHTAPGPVSQFDVDFAFLDQSRPQKQLDVVQKQFSTSEEAIDLVCSNYFLLLYSGRTGQILLCPH